MPYKDKEKEKEYRKKWYQENKEERREYNKKWYQENKEEGRERRREYSKKWYQENKEHCLEHNRKWYQENKEKRNETIRAYYHNVLKHDTQYKLKNNFSRSIRCRLEKRLSSKNGKSTFTFLPYTIDKLMKHLEKQFQQGMTWKNHGLFGWHIDHIIPDCSFNYKSVEDEEFQKCWALSNLQPLWAKDNLSKGGRIINN